MSLTYFIAPKEGHFDWKWTAHSKQFFPFKRLGKVDNIWQSPKTLKDNKWVTLK